MLQEKADGQNRVQRRPEQPGGKALAGPAVLDHFDRHRNKQRQRADAARDF